MDSDAHAALHRRLVELFRTSSHKTLPLSRIATILGVESETQSQQLRNVLQHSSVLQYDLAEQTVQSLLPSAAEDEDETALLALSDLDVGAATPAQDRHRQRANDPMPSHRRRSNSRHGATHAGMSGYRSDTGLSAVADPVADRSSTGLPRRRIAGMWSKPGQRALDDAAAYPGPIGRVGYVCVADELHLGKLEAYYRAQGYYTKFDFDVLHVRFAQQPLAVATSTREQMRRAASNGSASRTKGTTPSIATATTVAPDADEELPRSGSGTGVARNEDTAATLSARRSYGTTGKNATSNAGSGTEGGEAPAAATATTASCASGGGAAGVKHGFDLFIFPYGAVVWWGFDQRYFKIVENDYMLPNSAISYCMTNRYTTQLVNENYPVWCTYSLVRRDTLEVDDDFTARLRFDHFVIPYSRGEVATGSVLMLCASHALAQSAKIDYIELQVQELAESCSPLPRELREKGRVSITERRLLQLRGEVLSYRLMLKSGSDLLDEPDFFWENAYLKPVFQATKHEFEITERVEALDNKLDATNEILSMLADDFSQRHGARLEWIVIWLVLVEVVIGVLELLVDVRPWIRSV